VKNKAYWKYALEREGSCHRSSDRAQRLVALPKS
jgi:hypothetical protein